MGNSSSSRSGDRNSRKGASAGSSSFPSTVNVPPSNSSSSNRGAKGPDPTKAIKIVILRDQVSQTTGSGGAIGGGLKVSKGFNWNRFIIVSGVSYFIFCFILALSPFAQSLLLYLNFIRFPFGDLTNLHRFGLSHARNIRMTTKDGMVLKGYHLLPAHLRHWGSESDANKAVNYDQLLQDSDRVIIYFHGNAATRAAPFRLHAIKQMSYFMNSHVITFDYRGFGDSQGWPTEEGTYLDGLAAVQWVLERFHCVSRETFPPVYTSSDHGWADDDVNTDTDSFQGLTTDSYALESLWSWFPFYRPAPRGSGSGSVSSQITHLKRLYDDATKSDSTRLSQQTELCLQRTKPKIYLYGQSLGSGIVSEVALRLNAYRPGTIHGVIYDAPFATAPRAAMTHPVGAPLRVFPFITNLLMKSMRIFYANEDKIAYLGAPVLLMHGAQDGQITPDNSEHLFDQAIRGGFYQASNFTELALIAGEQKTGLHPIEYVSFPTAGHNDIHDAPTYMSTLVDFFRAVEKV